MINTEMLDRLMKPIINEDLERLDESRASRKIGKLRLYSNDKVLLIRHYNDKFASNISHYIKKKNYSRVDYWVGVINATVRLYKTLFGFNDMKNNTSITTMADAMGVSDHKFIKDAFKRRDKNERKNISKHYSDYRSLIALRDVLTSFVNSNGEYSPDNKKPNTPYGKQSDDKYRNTRWASDKSNYWNQQSKKPVSDDRLWGGLFMNLNSTIKRLLSDNNTSDMQAEIQNLTKCRNIMARKATDTPAKNENFARGNLLYKFIFEQTARSEEIKQQISDSGLLRGEWPDRFDKATDKQQVITDIDRLIELLRQWCKTVNAESLGQRVDTPQQPQQAQQPQSDKIKRIENEWRAFTYNKKLAPDYNFDFKRFILTRGTFSADGKDPGLMNGYEGPKKSGTLKSASFTPADFNAWLGAKANGTDGIKSIKDELTSAKGYENKHINRIWNATTNSKPA